MKLINCSLIEFKKIGSEKGYLTPIESNNDIPFEIKRIYYIYDVPNVRRGFHSHKNLEQVLIAIKGKVKILIKNGEKEEIVTLEKPNEGLYIGPMVWREMYDFSKDCVLLVLASKLYDESDYIRDYNKYLEMSDKYFSN